MLTIGAVEVDVEGLLVSSLGFSLVDGLVETDSLVLSLVEGLVDVDSLGISLGFWLVEGEVDVEVEVDVLSSQPITPNASTASVDNSKILFS